MKKTDFFATRRPKPNQRRNVEIGLSESKKTNKIKALNAVFQRKNG
jgi:hypothetical protein